MKLDDDEGEREDSDTMYLVHKDLTFCTSLKMNRYCLKVKSGKLMQNVKPLGFTEFPAK